MYHTMLKSGNYDLLNFTKNLAFSVSRSPLCFFCRSFTKGASCCIRRCDLICFTNSGNSARRTTTVSRMIDNPQAQPLDGLRKDARPEWMVFSRKATGAARKLSTCVLQVEVGCVRARRGCVLCP